MIYAKIVCTIRKDICILLNKKTCNLVKQEKISYENSFISGT